MGSNSRISAFISYSGLRSHKIADLLSTLLAKHLLRLRVFVYGPESGTRHLEDLGQELDLLSYAILVLTPENMHSPWIHFEAGAISKHRTSAKIVPLTFDFTPESLQTPLSQFGARRAMASDIAQLFVDMSNEFGQAPPDVKEVAKDWDAMLKEAEPELREHVELVDDNNPMHNRIRRYCRIIASKSTSLRKYLAGEILKQTHDALKEIADQQTRIRTAEDFIMEVGDALSGADSAEALCGGKPWGNRLRDEYYSMCFKHAENAVSGKNEPKDFIVRIFPAPRDRRWKDEEWDVLMEHYKRRSSGVRPLILHLDLDGSPPLVPYLDNDIVNEGFGFILVKASSQRRIAFAHRGRSRDSFKAAPFSTEYSLREIERLLRILRGGCREFNPAEWANHES